MQSNQDTHSRKGPQFISPEEAAALVKDNDTIVPEGFLVNTFPAQTIVALEERFKKTGAPRNLTLFYCAGLGDGKGACVNHLAHEGLIKRVIAGHYNLAPDLGKLVNANKVEAYNFPQGTIAQMFRDTAGKKAGTLSRIGLHTYIDPRLEGGKMNEVTKEDLVELVTLGGEEQLFYKRIEPDICFLRGTYADERGNITMEKEGLTLCNTSIAQAVRNHGGTVVVQVEQIVKAGTLDPKLVKIPGIYVDYVVVVPHEQHMAEVPLDQIDFHCGAAIAPSGSFKRQPLDERKVIGRRAAMELTPGAVVNLGIGMPERVSSVAAEEGVSSEMTLTVEPGPVGGIPVSGVAFGVSINPDCILEEAQQFDFYDGGGLDLAYLGLAECDQDGNINVSKMNGRISGCGGFINITQHAKKTFFLGTFTAKGLKVAIKDGKLVIEQEGALKKFVKQVEQITFSGKFAAQLGQPVMYITERAVFELKTDGLHLTEIAPGVDIQKHILDQMDFKPIIDGQLKTMDLRIFKDEPMGLKK
jgi:propionate CoA-transferase